MINIGDLIKLSGKPDKKGYCYTWGDSVSRQFGMIIKIDGRKMVVRFPIGQREYNLYKPWDDIIIVRKAKF